MTPQPQAFNQAFISTTKANIIRYFQWPAIAKKTSSTSSTELCMVTLVYGCDHWLCFVKRWTLLRVAAPGLHLSVRRQRCKALRTPTDNDGRRWLITEKNAASRVFFNLLLKSALRRFQPVNRHIGQQTGPRCFVVA